MIDSSVNYKRNETIDSCGANGLYYIGIAYKGTEPSSTFYLKTYMATPTCVPGNRHSTKFLWTFSGTTASTTGFPSQSTSGTPVTTTGLPNQSTTGTPVTTTGVPSQSTTDSTTGYVPQITSGGGVQSTTGYDGSTSNNGGQTTVSSESKFYLFSLISHFFL